MIRRRKFLTLLLAAAVLSLSLASCLKTPDYAAEEAASIEKYLKANPSLTFEQKESGLYYLEIQEGTGALPRPQDTAYVFFTGHFLNGYTFTSNVGGDTMSFPVNEENIISGFKEAVTYMNKGSKCMVLIPSKLAYGTTGLAGTYIGGYTPLLYDISLVKLVPGPGK